MADKSLYIRKIDPKLKKEFKAWCARNGVTMVDKVMELMRDCIKPKESDREVQRDSA